ncbi:bifunctional precorrin-2 dehydrogenase/sirohydrochlorin ferrochelatase [Robiginitalea sp. M366]|uniref:precorrin-2 dehydrogenase/sirohydrochlorin ferrochelatase family protein n=1 Tax=Robiginitalea aestuariiviva TaxID=3036903 RepID=UPI00240E00B9|nr:bifunctional precorrin-2 dehydrogenase/sirohydrochlorin ferrochelatase [Robiginitalea aestuariiviva]MDG1570914.1 bifunctional precorrin-2 dehydrogenase/sirohydrochlorin ferrochelatase [Robiginitalea aestuariiviva]
MKRNTLYPIFLKAQQLEILIVGGGYVAEEKLRFLTKSSPDARVTLVAPFFREDTRTLAEGYRANLVFGEYHPGYLQGKHLVIATTDRPEVNTQVYRDCRQRHILVNVADNPPFCDFYMGGIVTKGQVKIAISTNGQSPTTAKRLREFFEAILPDDISELVQNLHAYRRTLQGDFQAKVKEMNRVTSRLVAQNEENLR